MSIWLLLYRMKKITAAGVWEKVDEGELTKAQAAPKRP